MPYRRNTKGKFNFQCIKSKWFKKNIRKMRKAEYLYVQEIFMALILKFCIKNFKMQIDMKKNNKRLTNKK